MLINECFNKFGTSWNKCNNASVYGKYDKLVVVQIRIDLQLACLKQYYY